MSATSGEVWILAANRTMAKALEVSRWVDVFAERGIELVPHLACDMRLMASEEGLALFDGDMVPLRPPRLCICRVYEPEAPRHLELMGTSCQPSSSMVSVCYDKARVTQLVATAGVPMIPSEVIPAFSSTYAQTGRLGTPSVLKPASGRGGAHVTLAHDEGELTYQVDELIGHPGLVQSVVDCGRDVRVYVIGNRPRYAMERLSVAGDFRSNYSCGGTARPFGLTDELTDYTERVLGALPEPLPFGSVDFCFRDGSPVFCEVNANLGCHIPYEFGGFDLIGDYAAWIAEACL